MNLRDMMESYRKEGLTQELASARVCQDIVLKAIAQGSLRRNVTIKGGVVMHSITHNNRRATRDIDLDFIQYSLGDDAIRSFIEKLNCIPDITLRIDGGIEELKHQDYHGKRIDVAISDQYGTVIKSKIDIGVHKHLEIEQEEYCFDVCMDEEGACLLKNTAEQSFVEKLRSLLIFGVNSRRYKDIYDMFYLKEMVHDKKLRKVVDVLVFKDSGMRENSMDDICKRISAVFKDKQYLSRVSSSRQRWLDGDIHDIADGILNYLERLKKN